MATAANGCQVTPLPFILLISLLVSGRGRNANPSRSRTPLARSHPQRDVPSRNALPFFLLVAPHLIYCLRHAVVLSRWLASKFTGGGVTRNRLTRNLDSLSRFLSRHYNRLPTCERVPNPVAPANPIRRTKNWHSSVESACNFIFPILWAANRHEHPSLEIGFFITAQTVEFRFAFSVMSVSFPFAWHCFGR